MSDKPDILKETTFTVQEGLLYRILRTASIWLNKLFLSTLVLLAVWLLVAVTGGVTGCVADVPVTDGASDQGSAPLCNVFLTPTTQYLGAMAVASFALSILLGFVAIIVGKRIVEGTPALAEPGAGASREGGQHVADGRPDGQAAQSSDAGPGGEGE